MLQNSRKRKIKREVTLDERKKIRKAAKRRKRKGYDGYADDDLQDFIASDDEEEYEHYDYYDLPDDASVPSPTKSTSSHGSHRRGRFEPLTNVILLAGPVSSGKTSTAYAVANELQWQVFEVYPGIGKRGPKDLDRYVGMVGENHIMKKETPPVSSFFSKAPSRAAASISESSPLPDMEGSGRSDPLIPVTSSDASLLPSAINGSTVKQSCILIEEVDVLFEADSGFWEGLVSFIARSRRPVILTCNDVNAVPKDSLPLQNILYFHALERSIARNLLTEIGHFEGKEVSAQLLDDILDAQTGFSDYSDIRQAINQLQFALTGSCETSRAHSNGLPQVEEHNLRQIESALEIASFADAELVRRSWMAWEVSQQIARLDDCRTRLTDEVAYDTG